MSDRRGGVAAIVVALGLLGACGTERAGAGSTQDAPAAPAASVGPGESATEDRAAVRPQEVDLTGVDPCTLLTEAQRAELGAPDPPSFEADFGEGYQGGCHYGSLLGDPSFSYVLGVSTSVDFARYLGSPNSETREIEVLGFPAVESRLMGGDFSCIVDLEPAEGQTLTVQYMDDSFEEPPEVVCEKAATVAGLAIQTLTSQG